MTKGTGNTHSKSKTRNQVRELTPSPYQDLILLGPKRKLPPFPTNRTGAFFLSNNKVFFLSSNGGLVIVTIPPNANISIPSEKDIPNNPFPQLFIPNPDHVTAFDAKPPLLLLPQNHFLTLYPQHKNSETTERTPVVDAPPVINNRTQAILNYIPIFLLATSFILNPTGFFEESKAWIATLFITTAMNLICSRHEHNFKKLLTGTITGIATGFFISTQTESENGPLMGAVTGFLATHL